MLRVDLCDQVPLFAHVAMCASSRLARKLNSENPGDWQPLFSAETGLGWRVARLVSPHRAVEKLASGKWREVNDEFGNHIGYQIVHFIKSEEDLPSIQTPATISAAEMQRLAFQVFSDGKSVTSGMTEDQRLSRKNKETGKPLPPEDAIERTAAKVRVWPELTSEKGDILRVWPK